jgi:hypothetical protein
MTKYTINITITDPDTEDGDARIDIRIAPMPDELKTATPAQEVLQRFIEALENTGDVSGTIRVLDTSTDKVLFEKAIESK